MFFKKFVNILVVFTCTRDKTITSRYPQSNKATITITKMTTIERAREREREREANKHLHTKNIDVASIFAKNQEKNPIKKTFSARLKRHYFDHSHTHTL